MTGDPEMDHHAIVSDQKMTCTIVFGGTKGVVDSGLLLRHCAIFDLNLIFTC